MFVLLTVFIADLSSDAVDIPWWLYVFGAVAMVIGEVIDLD